MNSTPPEKERKETMTSLLITEDILAYFKHGNIWYTFFMKWEQMKGDSSTWV